MGAIPSVRANGQVEFAYISGVKPWHGTGNELTPGQPLEVWKKQAGMDFVLAQAPVQFGVVGGAMDGQVNTLGGKVVNYRTDTGLGLSVTSADYKLVQPDEIMEFFRDVVQVAGFTMHTAGTLFDGKRFWALARCPQKLVLSQKDIVEPYLLLSTACDGTMQTTARFTTVSVVCENTLEMAVQGGTSVVKINHRSTFNPAKVKELMGLDALTQAWGRFSTAAHTLSATHVTEEQATSFFEALLRSEKMMVAEDPAKSRVFNTLMDLYSGTGDGSRLKTRKDTAWGLVNAVTAYVDHVAGKEGSSRLSSAWFGQGNTLKTAALDQALVLVG